MSFFDDFEDMSVFTAGEFSDRAAVISSSSGLTEIDGIFDERHEAIFEQYSSTGSGRLITFLTTSVEANDLRKSDRLTINGKDYLIVALEPTHDGKLTKLVLKHG